MDLAICSSVMSEAPFMHDYSEPVSCEWAALVTLVSLPQIARRTNFPIFQFSATTPLKLWPTPGRNPGINGGAYRKLENWKID